MQAEPVQHVFINHDTNLLDVTLSMVSTSSAQAQGHGTSKQHEAEVAAHGAHAPPATETIHTTTEHPFLTSDLGWVNAQDLHAGEHVRRMDGSLGVVVGVKVVTGVAVRYNLTVAQDHTFIVGEGRWVVHNNWCTVKDLDPLHTPGTSGERPELENLSDQDLLESVNNPQNGDPIKINTKDGKVVDGNGRAYELQRRADLPGSVITPDTPVYYEPYTPSAIPEPTDGPPDLWDLFKGLIDDKES